MKYETAREAVLALARLAPDQKRRIISRMPLADVRAIEADFEAWAHESQLPPAGESWRTWLILAGRGFGKTRAGAEWVEKLARTRPGVRIALVGATIEEARRVMVEGVSGILSIAARRKRKVSWEPSLGRLKWSNGSQAQIFSGDNPDGLRGPEHDLAWCDELAKWREAEAAWDNLQFGLRRGSCSQALVTTTPRPIAVLKRIRDDERTVTTSGRTQDNVNLDPTFLETMVATYGGTRIGRQELDGELIEEIEGSLWPRALIERARSSESSGDRQTFERIVVGVDPPAGVGEGCDACGIVVCGRRGDELHVIADESVEGLSPEGWANRVAAAAARWQASIVVAEANNGGAMVASVLRAADSGLKVKLVHASKGKCARAEPVALRFEAGRAFLCGSFPRLEDQMTGMIAGGEYQGPGRSPDRADAMVWAMTELAETRSGLPRVRRL